jgi:hypothetical protein
LHRETINLILTGASENGIGNLVVGNAIVERTRDQAGVGNKAELPGLWRRFLRLAP